MKTILTLGCALALAACGNVSTGTPMRDAGPIAHGDPPPAPEPIDCGSSEIARFSGEVTTLADRAPIAGARVCVLEHDEIPCATTDASGFYQLDCAPVGDAAISFEADGFARGVWLWAGMPGEAYTDLDVSLARDAENTGYLAAAGMVYPDGVSSLITIVPTGNVAGLTAHLRSGAGEGAFYSVDQGGRIDPAMTSIAASGELAFFVAEPWTGWLELEVELVPADPSATCAQIGGAWGARDGARNVVRIPVRASTESVIWIRC